MSQPSIEFVYAGIRVRNLPRSLKFYRGLGFKVYKRGKMEHGGEWVHLAFPGTKERLELNFYPRGTRFYEPYRAGSEMDHLGFRVDDVAAWIDRAIKAGGRKAVVIRETHEYLGYVRDPDGVWVEFFGPPPSVTV